MAYQGLVQAHGVQAAMEVHRLVREQCKVHLAEVWAGWALGLMPCDGDHGGHVKGVDERQAGLVPYSKCEGDRGPRAHIAHHAHVDDGGVGQPT